LSEATPPQRALLERLITVITADDRIESAWLSGSFGRGLGDAWSDIDITAVVDEEDLKHCVAEYGGSRNPVGETVILNTLFTRVISAVMPDWERYDIVFTTTQEFRAADKSALRPLALASLDAPAPEPKPPKPYQVSGDAVLTASREFLRILGLLPTAIGRGEWLSSQEGIGMMRKALIELMIESNGIGRGQRGGAKRLNIYLTDQQRAAMEAVPQPGADRDELIAANQALAALFIPLARRLCEQAGAAWPEALEAATRRRLAETLELTF
jgi:predicted nucleotidyltransferase